MATEDSKRTLNKQVTIGYVRYDIIVKQFTEGMHRAIWTCSTCREEGAWAPVSADQKQAVKSAIAGLEVHHNFVHGAVKKKPPR